MSKLTNIEFKNMKGQTAVQDLTGLDIFTGRNGAGKTTCMRMICGLAKPTSGDIEMFGYSGNDLTNVRSRVGCLIETPGLYPNLSAQENLKLKCKLFGINKKGYTEEILRKVGLSDVGKKKTKNFKIPIDK